MTTSARFGIVLALFTAACSGRSIRSDADADPGDSSGGGTSGTGGVAGTNAGSSGSSTGGSAQGGAPRGGAGTGGENEDPARILFESADTLWATDIDGSDHVELCPPAGGPITYSLVDGVNERAILFRRKDASSSEGELLSVALDGSECTTFFSGSILQPLSPVVGGRVVFTVPPMPMSELGPDERPSEPNEIRAPTSGLASVDLDGSRLEYLAPSNVGAVRIADDRVLFWAQASGTTGVDLYTALPDASVIEPLLPIEGDNGVAGVSGRRVVVNVAGDVYAVDVDGRRIVPLLTGPETDYATTILGDQIIVRRVSSGTEYDLLRIGLESDELVPLTTSVGAENFLGATSDRVIFEQWLPDGLPGDIFSVSFRGGEPTRLSDTPDVFDPFGGVVGDRVIFADVDSSGTRSSSTIKSAREDGSDTITLYDDAMSMTVVGDRVVLYVYQGLYGGRYDLMSVPAAGGDVTVLSDSEQEDLVVGRLGQRLIVQRGPEALEGALLRVNADGTHEVSLAPSGRYLGAVTEACGAVIGGTHNVTACP